MTEDSLERRLTELEQAVASLIAALDRTARNPAVDVHLQAAKEHVNTARQLREAGE